MEDFGARARDSEAVCREKVKECDVFVGILGHRYGSCPPDSTLSYSEREYAIAVDLSKPRLMFASPEDAPLAANLVETDELRDRQKRFREKVFSSEQTDMFAEPSDLASAVGAALHNLALERRVTARAEQNLREVTGTTLLFPFVSDRFGFDTGISIANTSARPGGTADESGPCLIFYYGAVGDTGRPPEREITGEVGAGEMLTFTLSTGNPLWLVSGAQDFQGYVIVKCGFKNAYGYAFVTDRTSAIPQFASSYLAKDITDQDLTGTH